MRTFISRITLVLAFLAVRASLAQPIPGNVCHHDGTLVGNCTVAAPLSVIGSSGGAVVATSISDSGQLILTGSIAPTALAGSVNNYAPCDVTTPANCLATTNLVRQDASVASTVTGLAAQASGQAVALLNISATSSITLTNEDTNSTAPNRFTLPNGASWVIPPGGAVLLRYSSATSRWRPEQSNNNNVMATAIANGGSESWTGAQTTTDTGTDNDFALGTNTHVLRFNAASGLTVTGVAGGTDGRVLAVQVTGASGITFSNENAGSVAANRITVSGAANYTMRGAGDTALFIYDGAASRWRPMFTSSSTYANATTFTGALTVSGTTTLNGNTSTGAISLNNNVGLFGILSPAALTGTPQNDYTGGGCNGKNIVRQDDTTADTTITGLSCSQTDGRLLILSNISTTNNLFLTNEDAGSTAANRYLGDSGASCMLPKGTSMTLRYDGASLRWRGITPCPSPILETIAGTMVGVTASSAEVRGDVAAGASTPTLIPNQSSTTSGIGADAVGEVSIIGGGNEGVRVLSSGIAQFQHSAQSLTATGWQLPTNAASATVPTFVPNRNDTTTGIGAVSAGAISFVVSGVEQARVAASGLTSPNTSSYELAIANATAAVPTLIPNRASTTSGIGADVAGDVSIIGGGIEAIRCSSTGCTIALPLSVNPTKNKGTITLSGGTGTTTVAGGAICACSDSTAVAAVKCAVSTTTLTATGTGTDVISYVCL